MAMMQIPLEMLVIKALSEGEMSGYDLIKKITAETGYWKPSPGTIYPLLERLEKKGFITMRIDGKRKIYQVTKKAKMFNKIVETKKCAMAKFAIGCLKTYEFIFGPDDYSLLIDDDPYMRQYMHQVHQEATVLRNAIILTSKEKNPKKIVRLKKILRKASEEIKKL